MVASWAVILSALVYLCLLFMVAHWGDNGGRRFLLGRARSTIAINFLIIAWILFLVVKGMNRLRRKEDAKAGTTEKAPEIPADVKLLAEIRDLLRDRRVA